MIKIKPLIWETSTVAKTIFANTLFGFYGITEFSVEGNRFYLRGFGEEIGRFETIESAKQFAFDDFNRRLKETILNY